MRRDKITPCTPSTAGRNKAGYGVVGYRGKQRLAHRVAYVERHGMTLVDIEGLVIMHTCDNPPCVNTDHLVLGTQAENLQDMTDKGRRAASNSGKTHCKQGHEYNEENTSHWGTNRQCKTCQKKWQRESYQRKKAASQ